MVNRVLPSGPAGGVRLKLQPEDVGQIGGSRIGQLGCCASAVYGHNSVARAEVKRLDPGLRFTCLVLVYM